MPHVIPHPVVLDKSIGKCKPVVRDCPRRHGCATFLVSDLGRAQGDNTTGSNNWRPENCAQWRDAAQHRPEPERASSVLHDTPKGLL